MSRRFRVALLVESSFAIGREIQRGIAAYARIHGPWTFLQQVRLLHDVAPQTLRKWDCQGILARIEDPKLARQLRRLKLPTVDLLRLHDFADIPSISVDHQAVAWAAAEELLGRGFQHFAFCGLPGLSPADQRCRHFVERVRDAGHDASVYEPRRRVRHNSISTMLNQGLLDEEEVADWLKSLPKPIGLMTPNDVRAQQVLNACARSDIAVPEQVAVVGVDNDEVLCELSNPPLTSVDLNARKIGYEAAALLDQMIRGTSPVHSHVLVPPGRVVVRQSTDVLAIADPVVAQAVHFIREHACDGISVKQVVQSLRISRRSLERRFRQTLGRGPGDELQRLRLQRIQELVRTTDFPLKKIAELTGFRYVESLCGFFRAKAGQTPSQYRRQMLSG
jgi:LacI family transcriptional regulator